MWGTTGRLQQYSIVYKLLIQILYMIYMYIRCIHMHICTQGNFSPWRQLKQFFYKLLAEPTTAHSKLSQGTTWVL